MRKIRKNYAHFKEPKNTLKNNQSKLDFSWTTLVSLILTTFTALAYGSGQAYRVAYLQPFNFDPSLLPWSFQDTVYLGIVKQINSIILFPFQAIVCLLAIVLLLILILSVKNFKKNKSKFSQKQEKSDAIQTNYPNLIDLLTFSIKFVAFAFIVMLLATIFVANSEKMGKDTAEADLKEIYSKSHEDNKRDLRLVEITRVVQNKNQIETGYLIDCNERACGIYTLPLYGPSKSSRIVYLDNVISFAVTKLPISKEKSLDSK